MSSVLIASILESLFGITETNPKAKVEASNPPIEVGMDNRSEVESNSYPTKEGETILEEEPPPM